MLLKMLVGPLHRMPEREISFLAHQNADERVPQIWMLLEHGLIEISLQVIELLLRSEAVDDHLVVVGVRDITEESGLNIIKAMVDPADTRSPMEHQTTGLGVVMHGFVEIGLIKDVLRGAVVDAEVEPLAKIERLVEVLLNDERGLRLEIDCRVRR